MATKVSPSTFRAWMEDFGEQVFRKLYKKLEYKLWQPLYLWSKFDDEWEEIEINHYYCPDMLFIVPRHNDKLSPNGVEIMLLDQGNSFGEYLLDMINNLNKLSDIGASAKLAADAISSSTAAISSLSDCFLATKADVYLDHNSTNDSIGYITNGTPTWSVELNADELRITDNGVSKSLEVYVEQQIEKYNNKEEKKEMMKFDFGPVDSSVHMSMYGMAIKNASGTYVAYDVKTSNIMDVDIINFEGANKFMYKMPVALNAVQAGDVIVHQRHPMFVSEVDMQANRMVAVDIYDGEEKVIVPTASPFGFSFITKVVSLINFANSADASNPFGNMLPFLLMSDSKSNDNSMLMAMAMMGSHTDMMQNPMMLYALMNRDGKNNDMLPFLLMGSFGANLNGGGNCSCHKNK